MEEIRRRRKKAACVIGIVVGILLLYALFYSVTGLAVPCIFHLVTGWKCPGCGISTFSIYFLQGRFREALRENYMAPFLYLYMLWVGVAYCKRYIETGKKQVIVKPEILSWIFLAVILLWGIVRNIG